MINNRTICAFCFVVATMAKAQSTSPISQKPADTPLMPSVASLFLDGPGFSSTLGVVNESTDTALVQLDVYSLDGRKVASKSISIGHNSIQQVSVKSLLTDAGLNLDIGSIRVTSNHSGGTQAVLALTVPRVFRHLL